MRRHLAAAALAGLVIFAGVAGAEERPAHYVLTPESRFEVRTGRGGLLGSVAHNHVIRAESFDGAMDYDPARPGASHFEITVLVDSLRVVSPADSTDRDRIRETMLTRVLDPARDPTIHFESRRAEEMDGGLRVTGDLTLAGKTRSVTVDLTLREEPGRLVARGGFSIRQSDFGIRPYRAALGTIRVADSVTFDVEAVGVE